MLRHHPKKDAEPPADAPEVAAEPEPASTADVEPVAAGERAASTLSEWFEQVDGIKLEESDDQDTHVVKAELPGIDPDRDVDIRVDRGVLVIRAQRREEERSEADGTVRSEFSWITRSFSLPAGTTERDVQASYRDGILEIRVPNHTEASALHKVPVARG
jgi:HSP20 family protein